MAVAGWPGSWLAVAVAVARWPVAGWPGGRVAMAGRGCGGGGRSGGGRVAVAVAGWPGGRVAGWPCGRVAGWPCGRVAVAVAGPWPGWPVTKKSYCDILHLSQPYLLGAITAGNVQLVYDQQKVGATGRVYGEHIFSRLVIYV